MELLNNPDIWVSLLVLTFMEIVLGIDNIIFISIVTGRLPQQQQPKARRIGLLLALGIRLILLSMIKYIMEWQNDLFTIAGNNISPRDIILIAGGLFLLTKSTLEIHHKIEDSDNHDTAKNGNVSFGYIVGQILLLDIVFSFDSIITAVGLSKYLGVMIAAVIISMLVMIVFAGSISSFINKNPTMKMLALSFLLMIGVMLIAEGFDFELPKGYAYFAMAFSFGVEILNMKIRKNENKDHSSHTDRN